MTAPQDPFPTPSTGGPPGLPVYGAPAPAPPYSTQAAPPPPYGAPLTERRNGFGVTALVLGIVAFLSSPFGGVLGIVLGVLAISFGIVGRGRARRGEASNGGMALAGIIVGSVGLVLGALFLAVVIALLRGHDYDHYKACVDNAAGNTEAEQSCSKTLVRDLFR